MVESLPVVINGPDGNERGNMPYYLELLIVVVGVLVTVTSLAPAPLAGMLDVHLVAIGVLIILFTRWPGDE